MAAGESYDAVIEQGNWVPVCTGNPIRIDCLTESPKPQWRRLGAENAALRHQVIMLQGG